MSMILRIINLAGRTPPMHLTPNLAAAASVAAQPSPLKTYLAPKSIVDLSMFRAATIHTGSDIGAATTIGIPISTLRTRRAALEESVGKEMASSLMSPRVMHEVTKMVYVSLIMFCTYGGMGISTFIRWLNSTFLGDIFPSGETYWLEKKREINDIINKAAADRFIILSEDLKNREKQISAILDEVFFSGKPVLVIVEPASRFIFAQSLNETRKTEDWLTVALKTLGPLVANVFSIIADRGQAIAAMAKSLGISVRTDLFHVLHAISASFFRRFFRIKASLQKLEKKLISKAQNDTVVSELAVIRNELDHVEMDITNLKSIMAEISDSYSPCDFITGTSRTKIEAAIGIDQAFERLLKFAEGRNMTAKEKGQFTKAVNAKSLMKSGLNFYIDSVEDILASQIDSLEERSIFLDDLIPLEILRNQSKRKGEKNREAMQNRVNSLDSALQIKYSGRIGNGTFTYLKDIAKELAALWVRSSSTIEGHNGWLSRIMHATRVFSQSAMDANMAVKNFLIVGRDGKVPAERLFGCTCRTEFLETVLSKLKPIEIRIRKSELEKQNEYCF